MKLLGCFAEDDDTVLSLDQEVHKSLLQPREQADSVVKMCCTTDQGCRGCPSQTTLPAIPIDSR